MCLMDDSLFKLWAENKVTIEDVLAKAQSPDDLAKRIAQMLKRESSKTRATAARRNFGRRSMAVRS